MVRKIRAISAILCIISILLGGGFFVAHFAKKNSEAKIVVTAYAIYDIVTNIMGDNDDVVLLSSGTDLHSYEPTPADIKTISSSQLFISVGGESWVDKTLARVDNPSMIQVCLMDSVELISSNSDGIIDDDHHAHDHNHDHSDYDEHIWLSINNMITMAEIVYDNLILAYPHMQSIYKNNYDNYIGELKDLEREYSKALIGKVTPIVVADRFPFVYLTHDYNINYYAAFLGCSTETDVSFDMIMQLIDKVNSTDVDYIFILENSSNRSIAERVRSGSNKGQSLQILELNSCQSIYVDENTSYISIMLDNLENLKKAIKV